MDSPRVSVIMPVHNGGPFLMEAVSSILHQSLRDLELVVVDDGSTDDTVHQLGDVRDGRLVLIRQPRAGIVSALNRAVEASRAPYIARMDADDVALSERLERQVAYLDSHPSVGVLGTWVERIDESGTAQGNIAPRWSRAELRSRLIRHNLLMHPSVMIRRSVFEQVGLYSRDFPVAEDYDLWLRAVARWEVAILPEVLLRYRQHPRSSTEARQRLMLECATRARWRAIARGTYPRTSLIWLVGPALLRLLPASLSIALRRKLRHHLDI